eukprot:TRINITY_DN18937_c0_g1_i2.p1 TRINITY_DN18937_c0_g1~~TRINITY_DN18937_c0_g1_i2.p1  ORF type:complete len:642 (+),score=127.30 TRINITY_DN18937_c0_g1_i2:233-2158(+)
MAATAGGSPTPAVLSWSFGGHAVEFPSTSLSCPRAGATTGIDWPTLRGNLSYYAAMHLASEHILMDVGSPIFQAAKRAWYVSERYQDAWRECVLGVYTLKLVAFMCYSDNDMMAELTSQEGVMIHEVLRFLGRTLDWHLIAQSGWPLLQLLARLQMQLSARIGSINDFNKLFDNQWQAEVPFLGQLEESLRSWKPVPLAASSFYLSYGTDVSPFARIMALLALADAAREPYADADAAGSTDRLVRRAVYLLHERLLQKANLPPLYIVTVRWPVFRLAERLGCFPEVTLRLPGNAAMPRPVLSVLPFREKVSDVVRACELPYCDLSFMELAIRAAGSGVVRPVFLTEVGANLGDCSVWAAAHFGKRLRRAVALEPLPMHAAAIRRSAKKNAWDGRLQIVEAAVGDREYDGVFHLLGAVSGNPFAHASGAPLPGQENVPRLPVRFTTLARVLPRAAAKRAQGRGSSVSILKLWAYGDLPLVLRSAPPDFGARVSAAWVAFAWDHFVAPAAALMRLVDFFARRGFAVAAPEFELNWCTARGRWSRHAGLLRSLRGHLVEKKRGRVIVLAAFRPGRLQCPPPPRRRHAAPLKPRTADGAAAADVVAGEGRIRSSLCFFGRTLRQRAGVRAGAGYDSYFLGAEDMA